MIRDEPGRRTEQVAANDKNNDVMLVHGLQRLLQRCGRLTRIPISAVRRQGTKRAMIHSVDVPPLIGITYRYFIPSRLAAAVSEIPPAAPQNGSFPRDHPRHSKQDDLCYNEIVGA